MGSDIVRTDGSRQAAEPDDAALVRELLALDQAKVMLTATRLDVAAQALPVLQQVAASAFSAFQSYLQVAERSVEFEASLAARVAQLQADVLVHEENAITARLAIAGLSAQLEPLIGTLMSLPETENEVLLRGRAQLLDVVSMLIASITTTSLGLMKS